jgi:PAS domain S-box-containing protein
MGLAEHPVAGEAARLEMLSRLASRITSTTCQDDIEALFGDDQDLLCIRDLKGALVQVSCGWTTRLGFAADDLRGRPLLTLVHPEDVWETHDVMGGIKSSGLVVGYTNRYRRKSGGYRQLIWTAKLFGDRVFGLGRDVTPTPMRPASRRPR